MNTWESICISIGLAPKTGTINPVSLHLEYDLGGAEHGDPKITIDKEDVFNQMKKDLTFLRETWKNV
ncbi:hypothetical protein [Croceitalea sp. MTPC6]|uniref:hypothetical protein n=1 Tax=Croceitalea sp. MTPC6 TaxID=3056566 RepID=UPI0030D89224